MFCPRCATENNEQQKYCRQCGTPLTYVRAALEGHIDKALAQMERASGKSCFIMLTAFVVGILAIFVESSGRSGAALLLLGAMAVAVVIVSIISLINLSDASDYFKKGGDQSSVESNHLAGSLPPAAPTDPLIHEPPPYSAVEETTRILVTPRKTTRSTSE